MWKLEAVIKLCPGGALLVAEKLYHPEVRTHYVPTLPVPQPILSGSLGENSL